jgi:4'-phosphopantetheinyl transferase EntD
MIMRDLLPPEVAVAVATPADRHGELLPAERDGIGPGAVAVRREEFTAGRVCARRALTALGFPGVAVPSVNRRPVWPAGVAGSITHTTGYCAAAATTAHRAIGVDAERDVALAPEVRALVCLPDERAWAAAHPGPNWATVLFSAKETVYKLWNPLVGTWLGFEDVRITVEPDAGTFRAEVLAPRPGAPRELTGRFAIGGGLVRTAAVLS